MLYDPGQRGGSCCYGFLRGSSIAENRFGGLIGDLDLGYRRSMSPASDFAGLDMFASFPPCFAGHLVASSCTLFRPGVGFLVDLPDMLRCKVCVYLRSGDVGVPQKFLDSPEVRTTTEHVSSEAVS